MASIQKRPDGRWRARYRTEDRKERAKHFDRKVDAERWLDRMRGDLSRGEWVDPKLARTPLREYVAQWQAGQLDHRPSTVELRDARLKVHVLPFFGDRPIGLIRRSEVQAWVVDRSDRMAPATMVNVFTWFRSVMRSAVEDGLIARSPCVGIKLPRIERELVDPLTTEQVLALVEAAPPRWRGLVVLAAGSGLRQGELFGLDLERVDFLRRSVKVDRQLQTPASGSPALVPPKTAAARRKVPLADEVLVALSEHVRKFPPGDGLLFTNAAGRPLRRNTFSDGWRKTVERAGLPTGTRFHELRHYYASLLIGHGASVVAVQRALGHASPRETLETYAHWWPSDEDRLRVAVADVLGGPLRVLADQTRTTGS